MWERSQHVGYHLKWPKVCSCSLWQPFEYQTFLPTALRIRIFPQLSLPETVYLFANAFELGKAPVWWSKTCLGIIRKNVSWHHTQWARSNWSTAPVDTGTYYELVGRETHHAILLTIHWFRAQRWETWSLHSKLDKCHNSSLMSNGNSGFHMAFPLQCVPSAWHKLYLMNLLVSCRRQSPLSSLW